MKYILKKEYKNKPIFNPINDKNSTRLFAFGERREYEISVKKKEFLSYCHQTDNSCYNLSKR